MTDIIIITEYYIVLNKVLFVLKTGKFKLYKVIIYQKIIINK